MNEYSQVRQNILNHLSQLSPRDKLSIQKKLCQYEKYILQFNEVTANRQIACILTIALSLIPAPATLEISKSIIPYLYLTSVMQKYFPHLCSSISTAVTLKKYNELKSLVISNNYNYQQVIEIIERFILEIDALIKKYNHGVANFGGMIGLTGGRLFSKIPPFSYTGFIGKIIIPFIASNIGVAKAPDYIKFRENDNGHINNTRENQPLSVNDILITIRCYMTSEIDGFENSLREIVNNQSKKEFITKCIYIVDNGWNNNFTNMYNEQNPNDYYIYVILKKLLQDPLQSIFGNRPDLSPQSLYAIAFFTRLQLYKLIFEVAKNDISLVDKHWLKEAKIRLDNEFSKVASSYPINYNGHILRDAADSQLAILSAHQSIKYFNDYILPMYYTFAGIYILYQYFLHTISTEMQIGVLLLTLIIDNYYKQSLNASSTAKQFLNQDLPAQRKQQEIISDRNLLRFFHVSQDELNELDRPVFQP